MLAKQCVEELLARDLESFDWVKKLTSDELRQEVTAISPTPTFKRECWDHQLACFLIGAALPRFLFHMGMGAGKTKIACDLITHFKRSNRFTRALVTVPRKVNIDTWERLVKDCSELSVRGAVGSVAEKRAALLEPTTDLTIVDYQGLALSATLKRRRTRGKGNELAIDESTVVELQRLYDVIIIDETHKCKSHQSLYFKILRQLTRTARRVYGLTGTLFGRDPQDVWAQLFLIDRGESFGATLTLFRQAYFDEQHAFFGGTEYKFRADMHEQFHRALQHRTIRYNDSELQSLPELVTIERDVRLTDAQRSDVRNALDGLVAASGDLRAIDAAFVRLRQISSGYLVFKDAEEQTHTLEYDENPKLEALLDIVESVAEDEKIVIFLDFVKSGALIADRLKAIGVKNVRLYGGVKDPVAALRSFIEDPRVRVLIASSEAGGTGVDGLQAVANRVVFFESPVSPITRAQAIKRVHRPGQEKRTYVIDLVCNNVADRRILSFMAEDKSLYDSLVEGARDELSR